ncbi:MAG: hypothetical protein JNK72_17870 [Myxococcales bacterium]|nr:hypothetical protein [Myxococcales bacterium]
MLRQTLESLGFVTATLCLWAALAPRLSPSLGTAMAAFSVATAAILGGVTLAPFRSAPPRARDTLANLALGLVAVAGSFVSGSLVPSVAGSLGVIFIGVAVGHAVGARMQHAAHLTPVALVSAAVDLWSVTSPHGPTHTIVRNPALLRLLTVSVAPPGGGDPLPAIGFGDAAFVALYLSAASRFRVSKPKMLACLGAGLVGSCAVAIGLGRPVPALPLMGAAVVLLTPEARAIRAEDRAATGFAALLLAASVARALTR